MDVPRFLLAGAVRGALYCMLVLAAGLLTPFGLGLVFLPQPFAEVVFGRWSLWLDIASLRTCLWFLYVFVVHVALYYLVSKIGSVSRRSYLWVGIALYFMNLLLVLAGFSVVCYRLLVEVYAIQLLGMIPGTLVTIGIEWLAYRATRRLCRSN